MLTPHADRIATTDKLENPQSRRRSLLRITALTVAMATTPLSFAQGTTEEQIEEVVVTGSFIRNSKFAQNNPVDSVSQDDILESGSPDMGTYIRDLTYAQNINVVANVNASNSGTQSSVGATFNLRGLGENSTLTLMDGTRSVDNGISTLLPDIAIDRLEVVLDGGSALYGSDAVAGVINLIPIKDFDGFRTRVYHQRDSRNSFEDNKIGALYGHTFSNGLSWVIAGDYMRTTPLMNYERPYILRADYGWSNSGNPGVWRELVGATPNPGQVHGGTMLPGNMVDPSCGTFNDPSDLGAALNNPSGIPQPGGNCFFTYSAQWPQAEGKTEYNVYQNLAWDLNDRVQLQGQMSLASRKNDNHNTLTYQLNANNRNALVVPASHPNNPFGIDVGPFAWRPFAAAGTLPSYADPATGARKQTTTDKIQRYKFGASFEIGNSWVGNSYYSWQNFKKEDEDKMIHGPRLAAALIGQGGPSGNEWLNPFGSADPRSPFFIAGQTENSQALVDWLAPEVDFTDIDTTLQIFELNATGEVLDMPAGPLSMAVGYQRRDIDTDDYANPLAAAGLDYNTSVIDSPPVDTSYGSAVNAAYLELEVPLAENIDAQLAVRYEDFADYGIDTTTPKLAMRWEALPTLAIRGSVGESFLAPTPEDARPFDPNENCGEIFFGADPLTGGILNGGASCSSGNPNLRPEVSDLWNLGFTWEPTDAWSVNLDYQSIEYTDRIRTLGTTDVVDIEFQAMLDAIGVTAANYDPTPGSATRTAANQWIAAGGDPRVSRDAASQRVVRVVRQAQNISSVFVDLFDGRVSYTLDTDNLGTFNTTWSATYYTKYEYEDQSGGIQDALGNQNARTGIVAPVPELKAQARLNWYRGNHSAGAIVNYHGEVNFDDNVNNALTGTPAPANGKIDAQSRVNVNYSYMLDRYFDSEFTISVGINNLFDEKVQLLPILGGFESRLQTPWGRQFWLSVDWQRGQ
jgi:iron complex outermembrane recepter protein